MNTRFPLPERERERECESTGVYRSDGFAGERINCPFLTHGSTADLSKLPRAQTGPPCSLAAPKLLSLRDRLGGSGVVPITVPSRKIYVRLAYCIIVLYAAACRRHAQTQAGAQCDRVYTAARGEQEARRYAKAEGESRECRHALGDASSLRSISVSTGGSASPMVEETAGPWSLLSFGPLVCEPATRSAYQTRPSPSSSPPLLILSLTLPSLERLSRLSVQTTAGVHAHTHTVSPDPRFLRDRVCESRRLTAFLFVIE